VKFSLIDDRLVQEPLNLKPQNLIENQILSQSALLGGKFGISLINQTLKTALTKLENITKNFAEFAYQPQQKDKYSFLKDFHKSIVFTEIIKKNNFIKDLRTKLLSDNLNDMYFESGKTIYISVSYALSYGEKGYNGLTGHYALLVGKYVDSFMYEGKKYYIYPADDSLWGQVYVLVPMFKDVTSKFNHPKILDATYDGTYLHNITSLAIGLD